MRALITIFLVAVLIFIGFQAYHLHQQTADFAKQASDLNTEANALSAENQKYSQDIQYYQNPANLGKEALKYNRKKPGEDLYILVPSKNASTGQ